MTEADRLLRAIARLHEVQETDLRLLYDLRHGWQAELRQSGSESIRSCGDTWAAALRKLSARIGRGLASRRASA